MMNKFRPKSPPLIFFCGNQTYYYYIFTFPVRLQTLQGKVPEPIKPRCLYQPVPLQFLHSFSST